MDPTTIEKLRKKADEAVRAKNYDYAIKMYQDILAAHADSAQDRKYMRTVQRKRFLEKGGSGAFGKLMGKMPNVKLESAKLSKKWDKVLEEAEKALEKDPFNPQVLKALAEAAAHLNMEQTTLYAYEDILSLAADDVDALRALGHYWFEKDPQKATGYFQKIRKIVPEDKEAHQAIRDLAARATMNQGVEKAALQTGDYHDMLKNKDMAQKLEDQQRVAKTADEIQKAIAHIKEDLAAKPRDARLWVKLSDEYVKIKEFAEARQALTKATEIDDANLSYRFKLGDVILKEMDARIAAAEEAAAKHPDDAGALKTVADLKAQRTATAIADFAERAKAYPTDLEIRYRYGELLFKAGRVKEAIAELQQAVNDPKRKRAALIYLGNAFLREGMAELAQTQLTKALEGKYTMDDEGKLIYYHLGIVHERLKQVDKAREAYQKILAVDFTYKDVSDRLKKLSSEGSAPPSP